MKSIIIDAGHGGSDSGATAFGITEKAWNLKMSRYQHQRLKELGANVALTRTTDQTLDPTTRTNKIKSKYDYCISNHFNAFNGSARGIETIHSIHANPRFANDLANALKQATGLPLRRVFTRKNDRGSDWYFMHRQTGTTKTVIIEYGFLDNTHDFNFYKIDTNFYKAAEAVIQVICKQIGITYQAPKPPTKQPQTLYRVQTGAFAKKENAEMLVDQLKQAGFEAFITK